jgi:LAO/AO transport system kinase
LDKNLTVYPGLFCDEENSMKNTTSKILQGDQLAGARLMRQLENGDPLGTELLKALYPHTGKAFVIGITGPPGAGKSTLVDGIISEFRKRDSTVGVVAVDPSSPISGGALLGDRLRMRRHSEDEGVFIRSMATRGHMGGLSRTARETVLVLDAMGYDVILIETVGVGQDEVEIAKLAHTTAVISLPGMGDDIQAMKAGLLEIGDVFVVNKADKPGVEDVVAQLQMMIEMRAIPEGDWKPPVIKTVALKGKGILELVDAMGTHRDFLATGGKFHEHNREQEYQLFRQILMEMATQKIFDQAADSGELKTLIENLRNRKVDPYSAAEMIVKKVRFRKPL